MNRFIYTPPQRHPKEDEWRNEILKKINSGEPVKYYGPSEYLCKQTLRKVSVKGERMEVKMIDGNVRKVLLTHVTCEELEEHYRIMNALQGRLYTKAIIY